MIEEPGSSADAQAEAYATLLAKVGRKSPTIPPGDLVDLVMGCVPATEWPVRVEAMDAVLRRLESVKKDQLRIGSRPEGGRYLGSYTTRRARTDVRPYRTDLRGVAPIEGSCDCPDFLKNSLGVCKHLLVVLAAIHARPRVLREARKEAEARRGSPRPGLRWNPVRPLTGDGDWLDRVTCVAPESNPSPRWTKALEWFRSGDDGPLVLADPRTDDPPKRLAMVEDLLRVVPEASSNLVIDPALRALLVGERARLKRLLKRAPTSHEIETAIGGLKRNLYPYQREGVDRFLATGRLLLADDMGLGKTAQAIASFDILFRLRRVRRGLIIAPASLKPQWAREWSAFSDLPIVVVDGSPGDRQEIYRSYSSGFLIINYEQLLRDHETIRQWNPDLIVLDEAQRIKNWATKTAMAVKGLDPPYRLVLTGTPMENRIDELASVVEWVDDMALEPKWRLGSLHSVYADGRREVTGVRHLDTLRARLRGCMVRRIRQEVLDQLPPRTDVRVPIEMTEPQLEEHDALIPPILALMARAKKRPLTQPEFLRLMSLLTSQRVISNGLAQFQFVEVWPTIRNRIPEETLIRGLSSPKLLELRQLVRQIVLDQGRKVVIFSQWRRMLTLSQWAVGDLLAEGGLRAGFFTGAEGQKRRTQNIVEFHDDPAFRILFASDAGGVGLNLQHASNCVINLELPWNPAVLEQRIGRIYRLGQTQPIDVYNLVAEGCIESRIAGLVGAKQAFFKGLFDSDSDTVQFDQSGSFLSRVEKMYEPTPETESPLPIGENIDDISLDDEIIDPYEQIIEAADESDDPAPIVPEPAMAASIVGEMRTDHEPSPAVNLPDVGEVRRLFSRLEIRRGANGNVVIEAPPDAASALGALFEGFAALLQSVSVADGTVSPDRSASPPPPD